MFSLYFLLIPLTFALLIFFSSTAYKQIICLGFFNACWRIYEDTHLFTDQKEKNINARKKNNGCILHKTSTTLLFLTIERKSAGIYYLPLSLCSGQHFFLQRRKKYESFHCFFLLRCTYFMTYTRKHLFCTYKDKDPRPTRRIFVLFISLFYYLYYDGFVFLRWNMKGMGALLFE